MQNYLFVHFREKKTPDGEQVYFSVSKDGFTWETVNGGNPVLWSYLGEKGVRDCTIIRTKNEFVIVATDLSLSYNMRYMYKNSWHEIGENGSKNLCMWKSDDLINWKEQELINFEGQDFGCLWAPDIIYDKQNDEYVLHWSSSNKSNNYGPKSIYYSRTKDFKSFSKAEVLYSKEDSGIIDSAIYEENGLYYMFVKSEGNPEKIIMLKSNSPTGQYERVHEFDKNMESLQQGLYEAPTAVRLEDGRWCLFLDFYGCETDEQGYIPFVASSLEKADFIRSDKKFSFPYGFKHGTILAITDDEYNNLKAYTKKSSDY